MKKAIFLIFPNQLFEISPFLDKIFKNEKNIKKSIFYIIEDSLFFGDSQYKMKFHKQKIALHRATMKFYCGHRVELLEPPRMLGL